MYAFTTIEEADEKMVDCFEGIEYGVVTMKSDKEMTAKEIEEAMEEDMNWICAWVD